MSKSTESPKSPESTEIVTKTTVDELNAELASAQSMMVAGGGGAVTMLSAKSGILNIDGQPLPGNKIDITIVDVVATNTYYEGTYNPDNVKGPTCVAFGRNVTMLAPVDSDTEDYSKQHINCAGCPRNQWGSAISGKGKACKNSRVVTFVMTDAFLKGSTQLFGIRLPVTSVKAFTQYMTFMQTTGKNIMTLRTEMRVAPDAKTQFKVNFAMVEPLELEPAQAKALIAMSSLARDSVAELLTPVAQDNTQDDIEESQKF